MPKCTAHNEIAMAYGPIRVRILLGEKFKRKRNANVISGSVTPVMEYIHFVEWIAFFKHCIECS